MVGRTIGKYRIVEQIGRGGMGTVYKAIDETLDRTVAIKVLNGDLLDQDSVERFRREAVTLARLNHPKIGAIHEMTRDGHNLLMVMEFIAGETFEKLIERSAPLAVPDAVRLCAQVLDGLQYAHNAGVVHRDLKPANVIMTPTGDIKIMDFGIARVQGSDHLTSVGFMVGTPAYMSPEQVRGEEVDPRMDLYSIAVVLYRLLTHHLPFQGDTAIAMIHSQLSNQPTPPRQFRADLPDWIVATLARGLAKSAADRFQTATEFKSALEKGLTGQMAIADILGPGHAAAAAPSGVRPAPPTPTTTTPVATASPSPLPPAPQPPPAKAPEPTVTLRAPHLATAGVLIAVLIVGIGVLAFIALRTPASVAPPASTEATTPASPPDSAASAPPTSAPTAAPAPAPEPVRPPASAPVPPAPAPSVTTTPSDADRQPAGTPPGASDADRSESSSTAATTTPSRGRAGTPPPASAGAAPARTLPAEANAPAEHFEDLRALVLDGARGREVEALLALEPGTLVVRGRNGGTLRTLDYQNVSALTYVRARRPRGQEIPGAMAVPDNLGGSGFLSGARHWVAIQTATEFLVLRLEDRNVIAIMRALETRTGLKVVRVQD